jgi:hypothetical protein
MAKSVLRPSELYNRPGRPGRLGVSKTTLYDNYIYDREKGGDQFIAGTNVPRLKLVNIGPKIRAALDDEVDAIIEALRRERDRCLRASAKRDTKTAAAAEVRS